ncbi:MAG: hypothetical protein ACRD3J_00450 [Thermoanaerobaculia bacterium]
MTAFAAVIFVSTWNGGDSWMSHRYTTLRDLQEEIAKTGPTDPVKAIHEKVKNITSPEELKGMVEKLRDQRVERLLMFHLPWLGVSIDYNDIVVFAGLTFILLFVLLLFSLIRHHENLYLALYKVRRLAKSDTNTARGESRANFLYHALAMGQVLYSPPTLARWGARWQLAVLYILLFVPFVLETYITITNWYTRDLANQYGLGDYIPAQVVLCLVLLGFGIVCLIYSKAASDRWKAAFFHVNPARRFIAQPPWHSWTHVQLPWKKRRPVIERTLLAELPEGSTLHKFSQRTTIETAHQLTRSGEKKRFNFSEQKLFSESIYTEASETIATRLGTKTFHPLDHEVVENAIAPTHWSIRIVWTVEYD